MTETGAYEPELVEHFSPALKAINQYSQEEPHGVDFAIVVCYLVVYTTPKGSYKREDYDRIVQRESYPEFLKGMCWMIQSGAYQKYQHNNHEKLQAARLRCEELRYQVRQLEEEWAQR